ncbi:MAG: hypothetical protein WA667_24010 [Candidatus Nitrosopolaris sp.]
MKKSTENSRSKLKILFSKHVLSEGLVLSTPAKILEATSVFLAFQALEIETSFITSSYPTEIFLLHHYPEYFHSSRAV